MDVEIDRTERSASFEVPAKIYSRQGLEIAAQVFSAKADVFLGKSGGAFALKLKSKRRDAGEPELQALAGEFMNELLNQEYRFVVGAFNRKISDLIVTRTLLSARGGETPSETPAEEKTPEFRAAVDAMMAAAEAEARRTMPAKIAPQGAPLPPAAEDAGA